MGGFRLDPPKPTANLEPYYPGWDHVSHNNVVGEKPDPGSARDNYFGRAQAWGSILSGGLAGHIYGTGAYDGTTVGEEKGWRPYIWETLKYPAGEQVGYVRKFLESEGAAYQNLILASYDLNPRKTRNSRPDGLDGWAFMMRTSDKILAMLYFENKCEVPEISGLIPSRDYHLNWFDPISGEWILDSSIRASSENGILQLVNFPNGEIISNRDWSLKIKIVK